MRNREGTVLVTASEGDGTLAGIFGVQKPEPPLDLWEKVDKMIEEAGSEGSRPLNSFTTRELSDRKGVSIWTAQRLLRKLVASGKVKQHKISGISYYTIQ